MAAAGLAARREPERDGACLRRGACCAGSRIVPFEQIGQSAKNLLWRQKVGTVAQSNGWLPPSAWPRPSSPTSTSAP